MVRNVIAAVLAASILLIGPSVRAEEARRPIKGYVLTHEHPTYGMAFGGNYAFAGAPGNYRHGIMVNGYTAECGGCKVLGKCDHGEVKGSFAGFTGGLGGDMGDHASHMGPLHNSNSHLRYSTEWIKAAARPSGPDADGAEMKIMVAFAVENEAMCEQLYYVNKGNGGAGGDGYPCSSGDSWASLKRQLDNLKAWAAENSDWMGIAYTATDARNIIAAGKLAIVLAIESEYSFGSESRTFDPVERLARYHDEGVRTFYLAHKLNSRLAGADLYLPRGSTPGRAIRAVQAMSGCFHYDDNVAHFPLEGRLGENLCDNTNKCGANALKGGKATDKCNYKLSDVSEANYVDYLLRGAGAFNGFDLYPLPPGFTREAVTFGQPSGPGTRLDDDDIERNNLGLSHDGERVVREAMLRGMIVNIDHVSSKARVQMHALATQVFDGYPLNALHNKPNERLSNKKNFERHEYDLDGPELRFIRDTGGFFGLRMGPTESLNYPPSKVRLDCAKTSTETAKMLAWLIDEGLSVGYSLDYATVTEGVHSRTLVGCGLERANDRLHMYGRHRAEGLSHIGMMTQWHGELEAIGLAQKYLDVLRNDGAEQFIRMWERSEAKAGTGAQIPRREFTAASVNRGCKEDSDCAGGEYCARMGADIRTNICRSTKDRGSFCTDQRQCSSGRCVAGACAAADQCTENRDCADNQFCGEPIAGRRTCKPLLGDGKLCTRPDQCSSGRCSAGLCGQADECKAAVDCAVGEYCGDPVAGRRSCKAMKSRGQVCTKDDQCDTKRCTLGLCADADECRSNAECRSNQYCGDPIAGKRKCKDLLPNGKACTKASQCASNRCSLFKCKED
jgi:microsomal dipeptidase-like Zn-dependent dipeptidase